MADAPHIVWALKQRDLKATERLVLIYLANRANGAMLCWPAIELIATDLELSTRAVMRAVQALEDRDLIRVERRHRQANHYHIQRPNGSDPDPQTAEPRVPQSHPSATFRVPESHSRVTVSHSSPDPLGATESLKEPVLGDTESHHPSKKESSKEVRAPSGLAHTRARPRKQLSPDWQPNGVSIALGLDHGLTRDEIQTEAEKMRDWAHHKAEVGANWDARFNNWLRKECTDRKRHTRPPKRTLREEWNLPTFLPTPTFDDDDDPIQPPPRERVRLS